MFGAQLRALREKRDLSQDALGRLAVDINRVTVYRLEAGHFRPGSHHDPTPRSRAASAARALVEDDGESTAPGA